VGGLRLGEKRIYSLQYTDDVKLMAEKKGDEEYARKIIKIFG